MYLKEIKVDVEDSSWNASYLVAFSPEVKCNVYTAVFNFKLLLNNKSRNTFLGLAHIIFTLYKNCSKELICSGPQK